MTMTTTGAQDMITSPVITRHSPEDEAKQEILISDLDINEYILDTCYDYETFKTEPSMFIACNEEVKTSEEKPFTLCLVDDDGNVLEQYVEKNGVLSSVTDHHVTSPAKKHSSPSKKGCGRKKSHRVKVNGKWKRKPKTPKGKLNELKKGHLEYDSYFCSLCQNDFMGRKLFRLHLFQHYAIEHNVYRCCLCQYKSKIHGHINRHVMDKHCLIGNARNIFPCNLCDKSFIYKSDLLAHKFFHTRIGKHKCSMCNFSHFKKSSLDRHMLNHNKGVAPKTEKLKNYECNYCGYKSEGKSSLARHIDKHLGQHRYECGQCGYRCIFSNDYKKHCMVHSEKRPFVCSTCFMTFKRRDHLSSHVKNRKSCQFEIKRQEKASAK